MRQVSHDSAFSSRKSAFRAIWFWIHDTYCTRGGFLDLPDRVAHRRQITGRDRDGDRVGPDGILGVERAVLAVVVDDVVVARAERACRGRDRDHLSDEHAGAGRDDRVRRAVDIGQLGHRGRRAGGDDVHVGRRVEEVLGPAVEAVVVVGDQPVDIDRIVGAGRPLEFAVAEVDDVAERRRRRRGADGDGTQRHRHSHECADRALHDVPPTTAVDLDSSAAIAAAMNE